MELKTFFAQDLLGNVIPNATVYVYQPGTTTLATGLQDETGGALTNPFTGNVNGKISLAAPDGDYDLRVTGAGRDSTMRVRFIDSSTNSVQLLRDDLASTAPGKGPELIGFKQAGLLAVDRTSLDKMRDMVSAKDFGAVGDGMADDTVAIAAAYAEGTTVYFPEGTYKVLSNVTMATASSFAEGAIIAVPSGVTVTIGADIQAGEYQIFNVESGGAVVVSTTSTLGQIKGAWFDPAHTGASVIVRGQSAGHAAVGGAGLSGLDYVHIDGFRACEKTTTGLEGLAIGTYAGASAASLLYNTLVGYAAGRGKEISPGVFRSWTAQDVTVLGAGSFVNALTGSGCSVFGSGAMKEFETGGDVVAVGKFSGRLGTLQSNGVHIGSLAGYSVGITGLAADNREFVHIGFSSAINATQSYRNTLVGAFSGNGITTGDGHTSVGAYAGVESTAFGTKVKTIAVGSEARTRGSNTITIGNGITTVSDGELRIGGADQTTAYIAGIYGSTTASSANVVVINGNQLLRSTSSGAYKTQIEPLQEQWADKVLELQPVYYKSLCSSDNPEWGWYGLVAEDAAKIDPRFAIWSRKEKRNADGCLITDPETGNFALDDEMVPNGVAYDRLVIPLLQIVKRQETKIKALEKRFELLGSKSC